MDWGSTWDFLWHFLIIFAWIAYLLVLFQILMDLFWRDHKTSGWVKAVWVVFLFVFPWLTAVIYLIARGKGMTRTGAGGGRRRQDRKPTTTSARRRDVHLPRRSPTPRRCWMPARSPRPSSTR